MPTEPLSRRSQAANRQLEALRRSEAALKQAQRVARVGSWAWQIQNNRLEWSDEMYHIFGLTPSSFTGALSDVMVQAIHPDDRTAVEAANLSVIRDHKPVPLEYRVVWPDGTIRVVWAEAGELILDEAGNPAILTGIVQDITERKQAEVALRQSQARYRLLFDTMLDGFALHEIICDEGGSPIDYRFLELNPAFERQTGLRAADLVGRTMREVLPNTESSWIETYGRVALTGEPAYFEDYSGELGRYYRVVAFCPQRGQFAIVFEDITARKQTEGALCRAHDELEARIQERTAELVELTQQLEAEISERLEAENEIRQRNRELTALNEIGRAIGSSLALDDVLAELLDHTRRAVGATACTVGLIDPASGEVVFYQPVAEDTAPPLTTGPRLPKGEGLSGWVIENRQSVLVAEAVADPRSRLDSLAGSGIVYHSIASVPLIARDAVIGVMNLLDMSVGAFDDTDIRLLESVAAQAAVAIQNARLFEAEQQARKTAEVLRGASLALTQSLDLDTVLGTLLDHVRRLVPYDSASVVLLEDESHLVVRAARGYEHWTDPALIRKLTIDTLANPVARKLLARRQSVLIADTHEAPGWSALPGTEHIRSWLGVPLTVEGQVIGLCGLDKVEPQSFGPAHVPLVEALVSQAAVAVQNAWLFEQVRAGRERLSSLSHRLVQAQDTERGYIARELHDEAGQSLTSLLVGLRLLREDANDPAAVVAGVDELSRMAERVMDDLHRLAVDLRPATLDHLGLVAALRQHIKVVGDKYGLDVRFSVNGLGDERLPPVMETNLYGIVQEALTNVVRHAHATQVAVTLERRQGWVSVAVQDDGIGFERSTLLTQDSRLGLFGMQERAEILGSTLAVHTAPGSGTTISVEVPYADPHPDY